MEREAEELRRRLEAGAAVYERWQAELFADPELNKIYEEEALKSDLWLELVELLQHMGLAHSEVADRLGISQAQVTIIENRGYDVYAAPDLRRFLDALKTSNSLAR